MKMKSLKKNSVVYIDSELGKIRLVYKGTTKAWSHLETYIGVIINLDANSLVEKEGKHYVKVDKSLRVTVTQQKEQRTMLDDLLHFLGLR